MDAIALFSRRCCALLLVILTGCEGFTTLGENLVNNATGQQTKYTNWQNVPGRALLWRIRSSRYGAMSDWHETVEIQNASSQVIQVTGLCTRLPYNRYISPEQSGAFRTMTLYPGAVQTSLVPDGNPSSAGGTVYLLIHEVRD